MGFIIAISIVVVYVVHILIGFFLLAWWESQECYGKYYGSPIKVIMENEIDSDRYVLPFIPIVGVIVPIILVICYYYDRKPGDCKADNIFIAVLQKLVEKKYKRDETMRSL